jgi:hypothetical protein
LYDGANIPWFLGMAFTSRYFFGTWNSEVAARFLENLWPPECGTMWKPQMSQNI